MIPEFLSKARSKLELAMKMDSPASAAISGGYITKKDRSNACRHFTEKFGKRFSGRKN
jgi:hypothetical protein